MNWLVFSAFNKFMKNFPDVFFVMYKSKGKSTSYLLQIT